LTNQIPEFNLLIGVPGKTHLLIMDLSRAIDNGPCLPSPNTLLSM
jgi:hypothetical protein